MKKKLLFIVTVLFIGISSVSAAVVFLASDIEFDNSGTNLKATNLQDAIDEIYEKITDVELSCSDSSEPVIKDNLIPVIISDDGTVKYADTSKDEWYNYCKKQWANAVILSSGSYSKGDTIPESAIESYFVWIPKYKYKLWNVGVTGELTEHSIEIIFDTKDTTDTSTSCKTPLTAESSGNCKNGLYMTHPAFITMDVDGFWVGKFETGYKGATSMATAQVSSNDSTKIIVKPNVYSWRNNTVMNMFQAAYSYNESLNSHMMKNTEWGQYLI